MFGNLNKTAQNDGKSADFSIKIIIVSEIIIIFAPEKARKESCYNGCK